MARGVKFQETRTVTFFVEECIACGVEFGMPDVVRKQRLENHATYYCPNGHGQHYTGTTHQQIERELRARLAAEEANVERLARERDGALDALGAAKREAQRLARRTSNGVCTHCNRTFQQLQRHMKTKHPEHVS